MIQDMRIGVSSFLFQEAHLDCIDQRVVQIAPTLELDVEYVGGYYSVNWLFLQKKVQHRWFST